MNGMQRERHQTGHVYENHAGTAFYVRYRATEIDAAGVAKRIQKAERLCDKDAVNYSATCKPVKMLRDQFMAKINTQRPSAQMTVDAFWTAEYLPWLERRRVISDAGGNKGIKYSTLLVVKQTYKQHIRPSIGDKVLSEFRPADVQRFLEALGDAGSTVAKAKELAGSLFRRAVSLDKLTRNP